MISILLLCSMFATLMAVDYPQNKGRVSDFANVLRTDQKAVLNQKILQLDSMTTVELVVVTVSTLQGLAVEDYAKGLGMAWGVGKKGKDNGIVFLVCPSERKMRIAVADGLRPVLTDNWCANLINNDILPKFKEREMALGIMSGVYQIDRFLREQANLTNTAAQQGPSAQPNSADAVHNEQASTGFGLLATILTVIIGSAIIAVMIWSIARQKRQQKENQLTVKAIKDTLWAFKTQHGNARTTLAEMVKKYPSELWQDAKEAFDKLDPDKIQGRFNRLETDCRIAAYYSSGRLHDEVERFGKDLDNYCNVVKGVERREREINAAKSGSKLLFDTLPPLLATTELVINEGEVSLKARPTLDGMRRLYEELFFLSGQDSTIVDWLSLHRRLKELEKDLQELKRNAIADAARIAAAKKAGPRLKQEIPDRLDEMEKKAHGSSKKKKKIDEARRQYNAAISRHHDGGMNMTNMYFALMAVDALCNEAHAMPDMDPVSHYPSHSSYSSPLSTYSDSTNISSSIDLGGGGGFSDGGASGSWS